MAVEHFFSRNLRRCFNTVLQNFSLEKPLILVFFYAEYFIILPRNISLSSQALFFCDTRSILCLCSLEWNTNTRQETTYNDLAKALSGPVELTN